MKEMLLKSEQLSCPAEKIEAVFQWVVQAEDLRIGLERIEEVEKLNPLTANREFPRVLDYDIHNFHETSFELTR